MARRLSLLARASIPSIAGVLALTLAPAAASAEQFVLFDEEFTFTKADADANESHYFVTELNAAQPTDWTAPIDYRNGTVHIRAEVIDKPAGGEITQWVLCYIPNQGTGNGYGCTGTGEYTEEGVYESDVAMTSWWENQSIVWTQGIKEMHLVMKDTDDGSGHTHQRPDPEKFFPTTMRITMIQVSAGSTYEPMDFGSGGAGGTGGSAGNAGNAGSGGTAGAEAGGAAGATGGLSGSGGGSSGIGGGAGAFVSGGAGGSSGTNSAGSTGTRPAASPASSGSCAVSRSRETAGFGSVLVAAALLRLVRRRR